MKYVFLDYLEHSDEYLANLCDAYELVIDKHNTSYNNKYLVFYHPPDASRERCLFKSDDVNELKIWLDLNGYIFKECKIFYMKRQYIIESIYMIEYASIILEKCQ